VGGDLEAVMNLKTAEHFDHPGNRPILSGLKA
jgi:hypothetical protein